MKHSGEILKKYVKENEIKIVSLAKKINRTKGQMYNYFNNPELDLDVIIRIGRALRHDFSKEFPELAEQSYLMVNEPQEKYGLSKNGLIDDVIATRLGDKIDVNTKQIINLQNTLEALINTIQELVKAQKASAKKTNLKNTKQK